jgi:hypothetical protein
MAGFGLRQEDIGCSAVPRPGRSRRVRSRRRCRLFRAKRRAKPSRRDEKITTGKAQHEYKISASPPKPDICALMSRRPCRSRKPSRARCVKPRIPRRERAVLLTRHPARIRGGRAAGGKLVELHGDWAVILGRCNTIWATRTSSTPSDTANFRRIGFETSGRTERRSEAWRAGDWLGPTWPKAKDGMIHQAVSGCLYISLRF